MTTLTQIVGKVHALQLSKNLKNVVSTEGEIGDTINQISKIADAYDDAKNLLTEGSFSTFTKVANLEPRVMVEDNLKTLPQLGKFLMALTNIYTAYYLQAVSLSAVINDVSVITILDKFNPNRDASMSKLIQHLQRNTKDRNYSMYGKYAGESYNYVLPNYKKELVIAKKALEDLPPHLVERQKMEDEYKARMAQQSQSSTTQSSQKSGPNEINNVYSNSTVDNSKGNRTIYNDKVVNVNEAPKSAPVSITSGLKNIQEADNLAVGRLVQVKLTQNDSTYEVPVAVRVRPMFVPRLIMSELVALGDVKQSWKERWHKMRSGEISFVADWIFQSDIIAHRRKLLALDKQGLYKEMIKRRKNNKFAALASGHASIGAASSFIVVSQQTMRNVELTLGQPLKDPEFRNRIFGENSAMMIVVIDTEWERVLTYTRGISEGSDYSFKEFEGYGKGNGPDIAEIMKAYAVGNNPRF